MRLLLRLASSVAIAAVVYGVHWPLIRWVERCFPRLGRAKWGVRLACVPLALLAVATRAASRNVHTPFVDSLFAASVLELMLVAGAALPLLVLGRVARRRPGGGASTFVAMPPAPDTASALVAARSAPDTASVLGGPAFPSTISSAPVAPVAAGPPEGESPGRRRAIETLGGVAVLGVTGAVLGWGTTWGRHDYEVTEVPVRIRGLPRALDGYSIVQISDLHAGIFVGERELRDGASRVRSLKPDLVVVTGDMVDIDPDHAPPLARALADLTPRDGVFAILGNHDYYAGAAAVSAAVRAAGVTLLVNDGRVVRGGDGGGFALLGTDDVWGRRYGGIGPNLARAEAAVPADLPKILLAHEPSSFDRFAGRIALQLSGHTHGGQIRPMNLAIKYAAGRFEREDSTLYVNRGFGVAVVPARLGVRPEITKVVLVAA